MTMDANVAGRGGWFNMVPLLNALLRTRSVTLAARELRITQPAASQGLTRLRRQLGDPLLVQIGGRMQLTPHAAAIAGNLDMLVTDIKDLLAPASFDPSRGRRTFTVATSDYLAHIVGIPLIQAVRAASPSVQMRLVEVRDDLTDRMAARDIDFALVPHHSVRDLAAPLRYRTLLRDVPALLMDRSHPLAIRDTITPEDILSYDHLVFRVDGPARSGARHASPESDIRLFSCEAAKVAMQTGLVSVIPAMVQGTELVSIVTYLLAQRLGRQWNTTVRKLSFNPDAIDFGIAWSPVLDSDAAHAWFRTEILTSAVAKGIELEVADG